MSELTFEGGYWTLFSASNLQRQRWLCCWSFQGKSTDCIDSLESFLSDLGSVTEIELKSSGSDLGMDEEGIFYEGLLPVILELISD